MEFDPDKWWTWPIPEDLIQGRKRSGVPILTREGDGWVDGFKAGRNSVAEDKYRPGRLVVCLYSNIPHPLDRECENVIYVDDPPSPT